MLSFHAIGFSNEMQSPWVVTPVNIHLSSIGRFWIIITGYLFNGSLMSECTHIRYTQSLWLTQRIRTAYFNKGENSSIIG